MYDVLIIGGGVSGLTLAYELKKLSKSVCLIEGERLGGKIATAELEGKIVEEGPEEVVNSKSFMQLLSELGLLEEVVRPKKSRFAVLRNGKLYTVPEGIAGGILRLNSDLFRSAFSGLFSLSTLMRMLLEPLYNVSVEDDMSVKDLFTAIYGKQFVEDFFRPLAGGIYGGDIGLMSSSVYFPYILDIKKKGESVVRSFMKKKIGFDLISFKMGLGSLIPRLQEKIKGVDVMIGEMAREVRYEKDFISVRAGAEELRGRAAALMVSPYTAPSFKNIDDVVKKARLFVKNSRIAVINAAYDKKFEGYEKYSGILTYPEVYGVSGATFFDSKWPINPSSEPYVLKYFIPFENYMEEDRALKIALKFGKEHFGLDDPVSYRIKIWNDALPIYTVGIHSLREELEASKGKGIFFGGAFMNSTGIYSSVMTAKSLANQIDGYLETKTHAGSEPSGSL